MVDIANIFWVVCCIIVGLGIGSCVVKLLSFIWEGNLMGCDIHVHGEIKIDCMWHHYSSPWIRRDYALFAKMANVRNYGKIAPISEPRGIPDDASFITVFDFARWGTDAHSASWLSGEEIDLLGEWFNAQNEKLMKFHDLFGYVFDNDWNVKKYPNHYPKGVQDARLVFWFDN